MVIFTIQAREGRSAVGTTTSLPPSVRAELKSLEVMQPCYLSYARKLYLPALLLHFSGK